jgi:catechol 2,3-dioxygenase-like lactoylglutathione lyase family enzyme
MIGWIHHATLRVADVDEARERWSRLHGLSGEGALLRCGYEDYCLELVAAGDRAPGLEHVGWELAAGVSLDEARERIEAAGETVRSVSVPGRGDGLRLDDCDGNGVVVFERVAPEDRTPPIFRRSEALRAYHPRKLGHVNYLTVDTPRIVDWYERVLGFTVTDWIGDDAVWLHVNRDHHALAFLDKGVAHVHHVAFELVDFGEMRMALDHLAQHGRWVTWGPGRHSMAQNLFSYVRMPEEDLFVELFCDLEQLEADHEPRQFPDDPHASNAWGQLPPRSYFRFDEDAIRSEQEQREALAGEAGGAVS